MHVSLISMILRALKYYFTNKRENIPTAPNTTPQANINWEQYMGRWYELGRYETPFEYEMDDVYAEYEILPNGIIEITNYGTDAKGTPHKAKAQATISGGGSLDVSFIPLLRFLSTPYHVIYVDKDYRHAIVSNQRGTCLWILGRAPYDIETTYESLCNIAAERGFDTKFLRITVHHHCSQ